MKFKDMTKSDIKLFSEIYRNKDLAWDDRMKSLMDLVGKSERTVRKWASEKFKLNESQDSPKSEEYIKAKKRIFDKKKKRFIITWAQNNTPIHKKFFHNLTEYAKFINADIHVIAGRYRNPTSIWSSEQKEEESWPKEVQSYLDANRHNIHKYVSIMSDVKVQPTAVNPMTGMHAMSGVNSCIFGSPKLQMEMIPVIEGEKPKMMLQLALVQRKTIQTLKLAKRVSFIMLLAFQ